MLSIGNARKVGGAPNAKAQGAIFARFAVRVQSGKATAVPLWKNAENGAGLGQSGATSRTYAAVLAGKRREPRDPQGRRAVFLRLERLNSAESVALR